MSTGVFLWMYIVCAILTFGTGNAFLKGVIQRYPNSEQVRAIKFALEIRGITVKHAAMLLSVFGPIGLALVFYGAYFKDGISWD